MILRPPEKAAVLVTIAGRQGFLRRLLLSTADAWIEFERKLALHAMWLLERRASPGGLLFSTVSLHHTEARLMRGAPATILRQNAEERLRRAVNVTAWVLNGLVSTEELARQVARYEQRGRTGQERAWGEVVRLSAAVQEQRAEALEDARKREPLWRLALTGLVLRRPRWDHLHNAAMGKVRVPSMLPVAILLQLAQPMLLSRRASEELLLSRPCG